MTRYLLDTNVLSEVVKKRPSEKVLARLRQVPPEALFTSSICVMELRFGVMRRRSGGGHRGGEVASGQALWTRLRDALLTRVQVLAIGEEEGIVAGEILAALEARGSPIGIEDVLIAATAVTHGLVVSSRNTTHLQRIEGLRVESWWQ